MPYNPVRGKAWAGQNRRGRGLTGTTAGTPHVPAGAAMGRRLGRDQFLTCADTYGYLCPDCDEFREGFKLAPAARRAYAEHAETCPREDPR